MLRVFYAQCQTQTQKTARYKLSRKESSKLGGKDAQQIRRNKGKRHEPERGDMLLIPFRLSGFQYNDHQESHEAGLF